MLICKVKSNQYSKPKFKKKLISSSAINIEFNFLIINKLLLQDLLDAYAVWG